MSLMMSRASLPDLFESDFCLIAFCRAYENYALSPCAAKEKITCHRQALLRTQSLKLLKTDCLAINTGFWHQLHGDCQTLRIDELF